MTGGGLRIDQVGAFTLKATATSFTQGTGSSFTVNAASATVLVFTTQPSGATAGSALATQPVIITRDAFGNNSTAGLGATVTVTLAINTRTRTLQGTSSYNIGTCFGNGTITVSGLRIVLLVMIRLPPRSTLFPYTTSFRSTVNAASATVLVFTTQPSGATAGSAFTTQPVVKSQDAFGNNSTVGLGSSVTVT